jgi:hypothetical protein
MTHARDRDGGKKYRSYSLDFHRCMSHVWCSPSGWVRTANSLVAVSSKSIGNLNNQTG